MTLFDLSYLIVWILLITQTYYIIQLGKAKQLLEETLTAKNNGYQLIEENHGIPAGELFPRLQMETINRGIIDITSLRKDGYVVAFTSLGCAACKELYPILERFHKKHTNLQFIVMTVGDSEGVLDNMSQHQLTMPVVSIKREDMPSFQTGFFPFVYYLSPRAKVIAKSVISHDGQLELLIKQKEMPRAS